MANLAGLDVRRCRFQTGQDVCKRYAAKLSQQARPVTRVLAKPAAGEVVIATDSAAGQQQHSQLGQQLPSVLEISVQQQQCAAAHVQLGQQLLNGKGSAGADAVQQAAGGLQTFQQEQHVLQHSSSSFDVLTAHQQQLHHNSQQQDEQELQQHFERLLSHGQASTSAAAVGHPAPGASAAYRTATGAGSHVAAHTAVQHNGHQRQQQQQQHGQQQPHAGSNSNSTSSSRSGKRGADKQLVRPLQGTAAKGARACTPTQLAALSELLDMSVPATHQLLDRCPQLQQQHPELLRSALQQLEQQLGISHKQAAFMAIRQPQTLLLQPAEKAAAAASALAQALSVSQAAVITAAATVPTLLTGPPPLPALQQRLQCLCRLFAVAPADALRMVSHAPELLTDSQAGLQRRLQALGSVFKLWPVSAQRLAAAFPSALFMSPRIMNNKLKVMMAVLQRDQIAVGRIVYKTPQLLRLNLDRMRVCYQLLPLLLRRDQDFVFAMTAHEGRLLLLPPSKLLLRGARLAAVLLMVPAWQQQWQQWRPPAAEMAFASHISRFDRLDYLVVTQQADGITLHDAFLLGAAGFEQRYASWPAWYSAAHQQREEQREEQLRQQERQWQRQLEQQQKQQPCREQLLDRLWLQQQQQQTKLPEVSQQQQAQPAALAAAGSETRTSSSKSSAAAAFADVPLTQDQRQVQADLQRIVRQQLHLLQEQHKQRQLDWQRHRLHKQQKKALQVQPLQPQQRRHRHQVQGLRLQQQQQQMREQQHRPFQHDQQLLRQQQQHLAAHAPGSWAAPAPHSNGHSSNGYGSNGANSSSVPHHTQQLSSIVPLPAVQQQPSPADPLHWPQQQQSQWQQPGTDLLQPWAPHEQQQQQQQHAVEQQQDYQAAVPMRMAVAASSSSSGSSGSSGSHVQDGQLHAQWPDPQQSGSHGGRGTGRQRRPQHRQQHQQQQQQMVQSPVWQAAAAAGAEAW